jgi:hypothetical protein
MLPCRQIQPVNPSRHIRFPFQLGRDNGTLQTTRVKLNAGARHFENHFTVAPQVVWSDARKKMNSADPTSAALWWIAKE